MYKSIILSVAVLTLILDQSVHGGFITYVNYSDDNCTTPVGRFITSTTTCPTEYVQPACAPVPNSEYYFIEDTTSFCNATTPPPTPEGWYSVQLYFRVDVCSSKTVTLIQFGLVDTEVTMMANIMSTGLQPWNVTGSCDETTGVLTATACGLVFGDRFCPSGGFTSECTFNEDYQAAGLQSGCNAPPVAPVSPPVAPVAPLAAPVSQPVDAIQNSGTTLTSILVGATVLAAFF